MAVPKPQRAAALIQLLAGIIASVTPTGPEMDDLDNVRLRMRIANLEARRELCEIEQSALSREINAPLTSEAAREAAMERCADLMAEWDEIVAQLQSHRGSDLARRVWQIIDGGLAAG